MAEDPFVVPRRAARVLADGATQQELRGAAFERRAHGRLEFDREADGLERLPRRTREEPTRRDG